MRLLGCASGKQEKPRSSTRESRVGPPSDWAVLSWEEAPSAWVAVLVTLSSAEFTVLQVRATESTLSTA